MTEKKRYCLSEEQIEKFVKDNPLPIYSGNRYLIEVVAAAEHEEMIKAGWKSPEDYMDFALDTFEEGYMSGKEQAREDTARDALEDTCNGTLPMSLSLVARLKSYLDPAKEPAKTIKETFADLAKVAGPYYKDVPAPAAPQMYRCPEWETCKEKEGCYGAKKHERNAHCDAKPCDGPPCVPVKE
jgi:hypothetical protein